MSKHSKWAKIKRKKGVADAKKGAVFTKLTNAVTIAVREGGGGEAAMNFKLRLAIDAARAANVPKENIERAIARGVGATDASQLEELLFEGYGPGGVAVLIEATTDNRNRAVSEIKHCFASHGGTLGASNSVAWMFEKKGVVSVGEQGTENREQIELQLIDAGAEDIEHNEDGVTVTCAPQDLQKLKKAVEELGLPVDEIGFEWIPKTPLAITDAQQQERVADFLSALEDLDDVTRVYTNAV